MTHELNRVTLVLLLIFGVMALGVVFWAVIQGESLLTREDNARNVIAEQRIRRGAILDRDGVVLAESVEEPSGVMRRVYPEPGAASVTGYYSLRYGTSGIEASYDTLLRGDDLRSEWEVFEDEALHRAQVGGDVRLTVDADVQRVAAEALGARRGAIVIAQIPTGRVLALASGPAYDPNTLEARWAVLTRNKATTPLLNRATMGLYQPGGALETVLLAELLGTRAELPQGGAAVLSEIAPGASDPVWVNGVELGCLPGAPAEPTIAEAYVFGCAGAYVAALDSGQIMPKRLWARLETLGLLSAPVLDELETTSADSVTPLGEATNAAVLAAAVTGQGDLTVTPLHLLHIVAAVANGGQGVPLRLVDATRLPGDAAWQPVSAGEDHPALLRADVAGALRLAMLQAAAQSPAVREAAGALGTGDMVLYGHSALAYGGPDARPFAWFVGFVEMSTASGQTEAVAVVVVIENQSDPGEAARAAGSVLAAAAAAASATSAEAAG